MSQRILDEIVQLIESGENDRGLELAKKLSQTGSNEEKYQLADYFYEWGMLEEARDIIETLIISYSDDEDLLLFLAEIYVELDEEDKALELLLEVDEASEFFPRVCLLMADIYQAQGLDEVSERKLKQAQTILPDEPIIQFALAEVYFSRGDYEASLPYYKQINEPFIAGVSLAGRMAESFSLCGRFEEALDYYRQALSERNESHTLFGYGFTAYQAEQYGTAIEKLEQLKEIDPDYTALYFYLAAAYEQDGQDKKSFDIALMGINIDETKELHFFAGKMAWKLGNLNLAQTHMEKALQLDTGYVEALTTLTRIYLHQERYEAVVTLLEQATKEGEFDPHFHWDLARAYEGMEMYEESLKHYEEAYTFFNNHAEFLVHYGYMILGEGDRAGARQLFESALCLTPTDDEIAQVLLELEED